MGEELKYSNPSTGEVELSRKVQQRTRSVRGNGLRGACLDLQLALGLKSVIREYLDIIAEMEAEERYVKEDGVTYFTQLRECPTPPRLR